MVSEQGQGEAGECGPLPQLSLRPFGFFPPKPTPPPPQGNIHSQEKPGMRCKYSLASPALNSLSRKTMDLLLVVCRRGLSQDLGKALLRSD